MGGSGNPMTRKLNSYRRTFKASKAYEERYEAFFVYGKAAGVVWMAGRPISFRDVLKQTPCVIETLRKAMNTLEAHGVIRCVDKKEETAKLGPDSPFLESLYVKGDKRFERTDYWFWPLVPDPTWAPAVQWAEKKERERECAGKASVDIEDDNDE